VPYPDPENFRTDRGSLRRIALKVVYIGWQYMGCAYEGRSSKRRVARSSDVDQFGAAAIC